MKLRKILLGLLTTVYKLSDEEAAELLPESDEKIDETAVLASILNKDKERVSNLTTSKFDDGHKKGTKEALLKLETELKTKYGITENLQGMELIDAIHAKDRTAGKNQITEDDVKKHKLYIDLESSVKKSVEDKENEWKTKYEQREAEFKKKDTFKSVLDMAMPIFDSLKPILSSNPTIAANQKKIFQDQLTQFEFEIQNDSTGKPRVVLMKDGKRLEDAHGNAVAFEDKVKEITSSYFELQASEKREGPANRNDGTGGGGDYTNMPKTQKQFETLMNDPKAPAEHINKVLELRDSGQLQLTED